MGVSRFVALALLAPVFGVPALATAAGPADASAGAHVRADVLAQQVRTPAGRDALGGRYVGRLHPPAHVRLLAARLYWGQRPPSYPTTRGLAHQLSATAAYYAHVSRGREHVRVTLTRWVHVRTSGDVMCNTEGASIHAAHAALRRAGYHPSLFNRMMVVTEQCDSAASAAQLPGRVSWIRFRDPGVPTLVHELGHNLGLEHAFGVICRQNGRRVPLGGTCLPVDYGDSWDAMGHSKAFFSAAALVRLGWAGRIQDVATSGTYPLADVAHSHRANQALRIRAGTTTYWVEYQPEHSPLIGRTIPGVTIRRQVGRGPVEIVDASPGNPAGIAYPDRDLTNPALPVGSSVTTPQGIRITTVSTGRRAHVEVAFGQPAGVPEAPVITSVTLSGSDDVVRWQAPEDNGQIVLGYRVTAEPSGATTFVVSPAGYRTSARIPVGTGGAQTYTVQALNQVGWSQPSASQSAPGAGPQVSVTSPTPDSTVATTFGVSVEASANQQTASAPASAWAEVGGVSCSSQTGPAPYTLQCAGVPQGEQTLTVHVEDAAGAVTDVSLSVDVCDTTGGTTSSGRTALTARSSGTAAAAAR